MMRAGIALRTIVLGGWCAAGLAYGQDQGRPESAVQPVVYSPHGASYACHMNLGPTGAAVWMRGTDFQVMRIVQAAPAYGRLALGDLITGVAGTAFEPGLDSRIVLGHAIGAAEAADEPLRLQVLRGDRTLHVAVPLPGSQAAGPAWPLQGDTSHQILRDACYALLDQQLPEGRVVTDGNTGTYLTGLLLLASGEPAFLDGARRAAYQAASVEYTKVDLNNWAMGYGGMLLAEYYLATGDDSVLAKLAGIAAELARGQMKSGSWGHNSPGAGYGNLNQPAIACAITLVLARECGVAVDPEALQNALNFFGRFARLGHIPYGDHMPGESPDNNGTSASAAVLMHLAGREAESQAFARSVTMSHWMREHGHTGGFWSMTWGPLGAVLAEPDAFRTFMDEQAWYYHLARTWDGHLVLLPYQEALTRFDSSTYVSAGGTLTTGGMGLAFALPQRQLRILGATKSVFSPLTQLSEPVSRIRDQYLARDWEAVDTGLSELDPASLATEADRRGYAQLQAARTLLLAATDRTILEIESNLEDGHGYRASQQFEALKRQIGEAGDDRLAGLEESFADGRMAYNVREGKRFWDAMSAYKNVAVMSWTAPGRRARRLQEGRPSLRPPVWEPLVATGPAADTNAWRTLLSAKKTADLPAGWHDVGFDASAWQAGAEPVLAADLATADAHAKGVVAARRTFTVQDPHGKKLRLRLRTVRPAITQVYLNGVLVLDAVRGQRGGYAKIELDDSTLGVLRAGDNLLAVLSTQQGQGNNRLDAGLDITRRLPQRQHVPVARIATAPPVMRADGDDILRVGATSARKKSELQARYHAKSIEALLHLLEDPVAYVRHLSEHALVEKGQAGITAALALIEHADWKVRSSVCRIIQKAAHYRRDRDAHPDLAAILDEQITNLIDLLDDPHYWVQVQAMMALRTYDDAARPALPDLIRLLDDPSDWVRLQAIRTIRALDPEPAVAVRAAVTALQTRYSAYQAPKAAFAIFQEHAAKETDVATEEKLAALLHVLQHPPEGDGRRLLNQVMDAAAELDPDGEVVIPILIEAAADKTHIGRQRQDPRGHAIAVLGRYGPKAIAALSVLETILDAENNKRWHAAAREAIDKITAD